MQKGISAEDVADMLEESTDLICRIYDAFQAHPDKTDEEIYEIISGKTL